MRDVGGRGRTIGQRADTDGALIGGNHIDARDEAGRVAVDEPGNLVTWGPSRALGYLDPEQEAGVFSGPCSTPATAA